MLANGKRSLLLIKRPPCYSYCADERLWHHCVQAKMTWIWHGQFFLLADLEYRFVFSNFQIVFFFSCLGLAKIGKKSYFIYRFYKNINFWLIRIDFWLQINLINFWYLYIFRFQVFHTKPSVFEREAWYLARKVWRYQRVIIIRKLKKERQHNGQKKKDNRTNNDLQNIHIKLNIK